MYGIIVIKKKISYSKIHGGEQMKLILKQQDDISETEVEIRYASLDDTVQNLISRIEQSNQYVYGYKDGYQHRILINDIFYVESVDRKTFVYTESKVFSCDIKLYQILEKLKFADFVQVNKSCILNINTLSNIRILANRNMEGTLINGERILISRTFIPNIKKVFSNEGSYQV